MVDVGVDLVDYVMWLMFEGFCMGNVVCGYFVGYFVIKVGLCV